VGENSEKQGQDMEYLGDEYYKIEINKENLVSAYESTKCGDSD
jgi:hypothetical protein